MESLILASLCFDTSFYEKVSPKLKAKHLPSYAGNTIYKMVISFYNKYQRTPSINIIDKMINNYKCNESQLDELKKLSSEISNFSKDECQMQYDFILDEVITAIKTAEIYQIFSNVAETVNTSTANGVDGSVVESLENVIALQFDNDLGAFYSDSSESRMKDLYDDKRRIPFLSMALNGLSDGGTPRRTVSYFLGGTNIGKTYMFCSLTSDYAKMGYNVYYISLEMDEADIMKRIDANLIDVSMAEHKNLEYDYIDDKISKMGDMGDICVKRLEAHKITPLVIKSKVKELITSKSFKPDVIVIDYLKLMRSDIKRNAATHEMLESLTDELRNVAKEFDCIIISGNQIGREAYGTQKIGLENSSGSFGSNFGADAVYSIKRDAQLDSAGLIQIECLKSRFSGSKGKQINMKSELTKQRISDNDTIDLSDNGKSDTIFDDGLDLKDFDF